MGLVGELLPFLVAFYLLDSLVRVAPGQALFASLLGRSFRFQGPGWRLGGLLPSSESVLVASLGLHADATGVVVATRDGSERLVPYADMKPVTVRDGQVRLGPGLALRPAHAAQVHELATVVERMRRAPERRRLALLRRALRARCDVASARQRWQAQAAELGRLKLAAAAVFVTLFLLVPASLMPELPLRPSPVLAIGLFVLAYGAVILISVRLLRASGVRGGALGARLLPLVVFPPAAAHAPALVARESLLGFEPLAVAAALLEPQAFRRLEQRLRYRAEPSLAEAMTLELVAREARRAGVPEREPPRPADASAAAFCPHCHEQYRAGFDRCAECRVALERFAA